MPYKTILTHVGFCMANKPQYNFVQMWDRMRLMAVQSGNQELLALLDNHTTRKEYICRKLGVLTPTDVERLKGLSK